MQPDKLVMMANQIGKFFEAQGEARALPQITKHIEDFWDPRMRRSILAHIEQGGAGLDPLTLKALANLKPVRPSAPPAGAP
jgi:formate dehydrogenase subunit delta